MKHLYSNCLTDDTSRYFEFSKIKNSANEDTRGNQVLQSLLKEALVVYWLSS